MKFREKISIFRNEIMNRSRAKPRQNTPLFNVFAEIFFRFYLKKKLLFIRTFWTFNRWYKSGLARGFKNIYWNRHIIYSPGVANWPSFANIFEIVKIYVFKNRLLRGKVSAVNRYFCLSIPLKLHSGGALP